MQKRKIKQPSSLYIGQIALWDKAYEYKFIDEFQCNWTIVELKVHSTVS